MSAIKKFLSRMCGSAATVATRVHPHPPSDEPRPASDAVRPQPTRDDNGRPAVPHVPMSTSEQQWHALPATTRQPTPAPLDISRLQITSTYAGTPTHEDNEHIFECPICFEWSSAVLTCGECCNHCCVRCGDGILRRELAMLQQRPQSQNKSGWKSLFAQVAKLRTLESGQAVIMPCAFCRQDTACFTRIDRWNVADDELEHSKEKYCDSPRTTQLLQRSADVTEIAQQVVEKTIAQALSEQQPETSLTLQVNHDSNQRSNELSPDAAAREAATSPAILSQQQHINMGFFADRPPQPGRRDLGTLMTWSSPEELD